MSKEIYRSVQDYVTIWNEIESKVQSDMNNWIFVEGSMVMEDFCFTYLIG